MELMIVVVIAAILFTIALPAYQGYTRKAKRADGMDALMTIQQLQERYRANNTGYGVLTAIGWGASTESLEGYYDITLTLGANTAVEYTVTARGKGDQANDKTDGTLCTLVVTIDASNPRGAKTPDKCW